MMRHDCNQHADAWTLYFKNGYIDVERTIFPTDLPKICPHCNVLIRLSNQTCDCVINDAIFEKDLALFLMRHKKCDHGCRLLIWQLAMHAYTHRAEYASNEYIIPSFLKDDHISHHSKFYTMVSQKTSYAFMTHLLEHVIQKYNVYGRIVSDPKFWSECKMKHLEITGEPSAVIMFYNFAQKIFPENPNYTPHIIRTLLTENNIINKLGIVRNITHEHYFGELKFMIRIISPYIWSGKMIGYINGTRVMGENQYLSPINELDIKSSSESMTKIPIYFPLINNGNSEVIDQFRDITCNIIKLSLLKDVFLDLERRSGFGGYVIEQFYITKLEEMTPLPIPIVQYVIEYTGSTFNMCKRSDNGTCTLCNALTDRISFTTPCCNTLLCIECTNELLRAKKRRDAFKNNLEAFMCARCVYLRSKSSMYKTHFGLTLKTYL